jgi:hypothetical protein
VRDGLQIVRDDEQDIQFARGDGEEKAGRVWRASLELYRGKLAKQGAGVAESGAKR